VARGGFGLTDLELAKPRSAGSVLARRVEVRANPEQPHRRAVQRPLADAGGTVSAAGSSINRTNSGNIPPEPINTLLPRRSSGQRADRIDRRPHAAGESASRLQATGR
jgi:hypothetical protein